MEIVSIEKTFEMMLASFNALSEKSPPSGAKRDGRRLERWLTGEEVCGQLRISRARCSHCVTRAAAYRLLADSFAGSITGRRRSRAAYSAYRRSIPMENDSVFINRNRCCQ